MTPRPIVFDVDGVLANFTKGFTQMAYRCVSPHVVPRSVEEQLEWDFRDFPAGVESATWGLVNQDISFWERLEVHPLLTQDTLDAIQELTVTRPVYFATNRCGVQPHKQTERWLFRHGIRNPTVVVTARKGEFCNVVNAAACIDDKAGNAVYVAYECPNARSFLLNAKYNQFDHRVLGGKVTRVNSVAEFLREVEGL